MTDIIIASIFFAATIFTLGAYSLRYRKIVWFLLILLLVPLVFSSAVFLAVGLMFAAFVVRVLTVNFKKREWHKGMPIIKTKSVLVYCFTISALFFLYAAFYIALSFLIDSAGPADYEIYFAVFGLLAVPIYFSAVLARHSRTFIEDLAGIVVLKKNGAQLTFFEALARYLMMLATLPFLVGLINFIGADRLYNRLVGAQEYKNKIRYISDGWVFRVLRILYQRVETSPTLPPNSQKH